MGHWELVWMTGHASCFVAGSGVLQIATVAEAAATVNGCCLLHTCCNKHKYGKSGKRQKSGDFHSARVSPSDKTSAVCASYPS